MNNESSNGLNEHNGKNGMSHKRMYWLYMFSLIGGLVMLVLALVAKGDHLNQSSFYNYKDIGRGVAVSTQLDYRTEMKIATKKVGGIACTV